MEIKMSKAEFVELSDGLDGVILLVKKFLLNNMEFNLNLDDFVEYPSGRLTMHALENEKDSLEITHLLYKIAESFEKLAA